MLPRTNQSFNSDCGKIGKAGLIIETGLFHSYYREFRKAINCCFSLSVRFI